MTRTLGLSFLVVALLPVVSGFSNATEQAAYERTVGDWHGGGSCRVVSVAELETPPKSGVLKGICLFGTLYADSEWFLILPSGTKPEWDIAVFLPRIKAVAEKNRLQTLRGRAVVFIGDLEFETNCWSPTKFECNPVMRPLNIIRGRIVI
jgi:hypothetical protein